MPKRTLKQRLIAAIVARGGREVSVTRKTVTMSLPSQPDGFLYVGNAGSLRSGKTKTSSVPIYTFKNMLLLEEE